MQSSTEIITIIQEINETYTTLQQQGIQPKHLGGLLHDLLGDLASAIDVEVVTEHGDIAMMRPRAEIIAELSGINKSYVKLQQRGFQSKRVKASFRSIVGELASTFFTFGITEHKSSATSDHEASVEPTSEISQESVPTSEHKDLVERTPEVSQEPAPTSDHEHFVEPTSGVSQEPAPTSDHEALVEPASIIANEPAPTAKRRAAAGVTTADQVNPDKPQGTAKAQEAWSNMQERGWHKHKISWANLMLWDMCFGHIRPSERHSYEVVCSMVDREMLRMSQQSNEPFD